ncbi:MAG: YHS domain-containing protein [Gemmataceae bacterium]
MNTNPRPSCGVPTQGLGPGGMAIKVGVMGGASDIALPEHMEKAHALGRVVAARGCVLVTGACPGLPLAAACGAKQAGGLVVGVSPGVSLDEHLGKYASPTAFHDVLIYTGSGLMGREVINVRTSDVVVIVGGRSGTLGELAIAYDEGKLIGVLTGTGGISGLVADILAACGKDTGSRVVYETDPERLVDELLRLHPMPPAPPGPGGVVVTEPTVEDPVCRMRILPQAAAAERVRDGTRYWFCSRACAERFDAGQPADRV